MGLRYYLSFRVSESFPEVMLKLSLKKEKEFLGGKEKGECVFQEEVIHMQ